MAVCVDIEVALLGEGREAGSEHLSKWHCLGSLLALL